MAKTIRRKKHTKGGNYFTNMLGKISELFIYFYNLFITYTGRAPDSKESEQIYTLAANIIETDETDEKVEGIETDEKILDRLKNLQILINHQQKKNIQDIKEGKNTTKLTDKLIRNKIEKKKLIKKIKGASKDPKELDFFEKPDQIIVDLFSKKIQENSINKTRKFNL